MLVAGGEFADDVNDPPTCDDDDGDDVGMFCRCWRPLVADDGIMLPACDLFVDGDIVES